MVRKLYTTPSITEIKSFKAEDLKAENVNQTSMPKSIKSF